MSESTPSLQAISDALRRGAKRTRRRATAPNVLARDPLTFGLDEFLGAYRELAAVSARLRDRLGEEDPMTADFEAALAHARAAWSSLLTDGTPSHTPESPTAPRPRPAAGTASSPPSDAGDAEPDQPVSPSPAPQHSVELVPAGTRSVVASPARYPDEAALVQFFRRRIEQRRLPDESTIGRYLRLRRERGPRYPDEAALARYFRERREQR